ncbi:MAG: hypothetical protein Kow00127_04950 [Bacteroidales bacterium]
MNLRVTQIFVLCIVLLARTALGQQGFVQILDAETGEPVPYAHVCFESINNGTQQHTLTDLDGKVKNLATEPCVVAISYVGYETLFDTLAPDEKAEMRLKPAIFNMNEVVVTAQYVPQRVDKSIYKVKVIGAKQIEQKGANNLSELFSDALSIRVNQDGALGSSMSIRGLSGEHVKFLIDGVPVIGRLNGNIDLGQLNLNNVDHVEVIEGPMSVVYGSNALAGVVNIITKENKNTRLSARAEAYTESVGTYNFNGLGSGKIKNHVWSISGGRNFFSGFDDYPETRSMTWKPKRQYMFDGYYLYSRDRFKFKLSPQYFDERLWNKGDVLEPHYAIDNWFNTRRFTNSLDLSARIGEVRYLKVLGAYSSYHRVKETWFKNLNTLEQVRTPNEGDQDTTRFEAVNVRAEMSKSDESSRWNYQFGVDANVEWGEGRKIRDHRQMIGDYAAFLSMKWTPSPLITLQPGVRLIYNTHFKAPLIYSINFRWKPYEHSQVRLSYSRGFRAPSLKELYLFFVDVNHNIRGNEDLKAEDSHNVVVAMGYTNKHGRANFGLDVDLFYNSIRNIISIAQISGDLYSYINIDNYTSQGAQAELYYDLYPDFKWKAGVVYTGRKNELEGEAQQVKKMVYNTDVNTSVTWRWKKIKTDFSVFYKYTGRLPQYYQAPDGTLQEGFIDDYHTMDVTVSHKMLRDNLHLSGGVKNLFDVTTINATGGAISGGVHGGGGSSLVGYGRTFFVSLAYSFNKY